MQSIVLIESDWNLKVVLYDVPLFLVLVLIESDWNLKSSIPKTEINPAQLVLIESDWNLKNVTHLMKSALLSVLIESDWNLKSLKLYYHPSVIKY